MKGAAWLLVLLFLLTTASFVHRVEYSNEWCRYMLVGAVVDYHDLRVQYFNPNPNDDVAVFEGRVYSAKAIGEPLLALPVYWVLRTLTPLGDGEPLSFGSRYLVRVIVTTLPFCLLMGALFSLARRMGASPGNSACMVLAYGFGTIALIQAMLFGGHQGAATFGLFSFALLYWLRTRSRAGERAPLPLFALAGLSAGIAALCDYTAMYMALVLSGYVLSLPVRRSGKFFFLAGGSVCAVLLGIYNAHCFGGPFTMSYAYMSNQAFFQGTRSGIVGVALPDFGVLLKLLASPSRGVFFIMPVLLLSLLGLPRMWQLGGLKREVLAILFIVCGYFFINAGFYGWHGGWCFGPRYLTPMLPFLALPLAFAPQRNPWFVLLLLLSALQVGMAAATFPQTPETVANPLLEIVLPFYLGGYSALNLGNVLGLPDPLSLLPILLVAGGLIALTLRKTGLPDKQPLPVWGRVLAAGACLAVIVCLGMVKSEPARGVHCARALLLNNAAISKALKQGPDMLLREQALCRGE